MKHDKKQLFKHDKFPNHYSLFAIAPVMPQIIGIAVIFACYYYIHTKGFFPLWIHYIYYVVKALIALEIITAGAKSLFVPTLAMVLGALNLYLIQVNGLKIISASDSWELITIGAIAFVLTFVVRSLKR